MSQGFRNSKLNLELWMGMCEASKHVHQKFHWQNVRVFVFFMHHWINYYMTCISMTPPHLSFPAAACIAQNVHEKGAKGDMHTWAFPSQPHGNMMT